MGNAFTNFISRWEDGSQYRLFGRDRSNNHVNNNNDGDNESAGIERIQHHVVHNLSGINLNYNIPIIAYPSLATASASSSSADAMQLTRNIHIVGVEACGKSSIFDGVLTSLQGNPNWLRSRGRAEMMVPCVRAYVIESCQFAIMRSWHNFVEKSLSKGIDLTTATQSCQLLLSNRTWVLSKDEHRQSVYQALRTLEDAGFFNELNPMVFSTIQLINAEYVLKSNKPSRFFVPRYCLYNSPDDWRLVHIPNETTIPREGSFDLFSPSFSQVVKYKLYDHSNASIPETIQADSTTIFVIPLVPLADRILLNRSTSGVIDVSDVVGSASSATVAATANNNRSNDDLFSANMPSSIARSLDLFSQLIERCPRGKKQSILIVLNQVDEFRRRTNCRQEVEEKVTRYVSNIFGQAAVESGRADDLQIHQVLNCALHAGNLIHALQKQDQNSTLNELDMIPSIREIGSEKTIWTVNTRLMFPKQLQQRAFVIQMCLSKKLPRDLIFAILGYSISIDEWILLQRFNNLPVNKAKKALKILN